MSSRAFYGSRDGSRVPKGSRRAGRESLPPEIQSTVDEALSSPPQVSQSQPYHYWSPGQSLPTMTPPVIQEPQPVVYNAHNSTPCSTRYQQPVRSLTDVPWAELIESQKRLETVVGNILERVTNLEHASNPSVTPRSSTSSSEAEKKRIPPELSVCLLLLLL